MGCHFVEITDSKIQHPELAVVPEIFAVLWERREGSGSGLLLPRFLPATRWHRRDSQVLLIPQRQRFRIFRAKKEATDSRHFLHFRSSRDSISSVFKNRVPFSSKWPSLRKGRGARLGFCGAGCPRKSA